MTDWECGQDIIAIVDLMGDKKVEMKESHPKAYWLIDELQKQLGDYFNRAHRKSHGFGLISHDEVAKPDGEKGEK
jgi:hypothetical protein